MKPQKTTQNKETKRQYFQLDASKIPVGRLATKAAVLLRGKHKRAFSPNQDMGDYVVIINVEKLKLTGRKVEQNVYYRHSGYLGGIKETALKTVLQKNPGQIIKIAVKKMIDEIRFRNKIMSRLKLIKGTEHNFKIDKSL